MKYLKLFTSRSEYNAAKNSLDKPNVSHCIEENEVYYNPYIHDYSQDYLTFVAKENGTISFNIWESIGTDMITSISYSTDNGETWATTANQDNKEENLVIDVDVNEGDKVLWKGTATQTGLHYIGSFFSSDCAFDAQGNVMSLLYGDDFKGKTTLEHEGQFACLFSDYNEEKTCNIINAKNLSLPAITLTENCYHYMFCDCKNLISAPELPAIALAQECYSYMFYGCTNLVIAPSVLPATTLAQKCYYYMFHDCTNLEIAPELSATTLAEKCCERMFFGCTSLTTAPVLSATTLAESCYCYMFAGCTNLTIIPSILPATTLADYCYFGMFQDCTNLETAPELPAKEWNSGACYPYMFKGCEKLTYIKAMFTTITSDSDTKDWVKGVASTGTFVKNSAATWDVTGDYGVPTGWTVQTASE